jgi:hypothetical protein
MQITLEVFDPKKKPEIIIEPTDVEGIAGSTVEMPCYASTFLQVNVFSSFKSLKIF